MVYIKKMVMHGFKSFAKRTEVFFDKGINVILGPNGSGKSNISDSLCFVLGRLSIKSMRAAKARNLLFMGSKYIKPAKEASVEITFDNSDRAFAIEKNEITLKRVVRSNGQGIYKINDETKTRLEVIEMLAQAGIDPYGFNLILQGQIQSIVKMHPEDRRKIIEEVAGISIYESRKEKSLKELEKTEEKLKEIGAILRERTAYLRNLDRERSQALRFKELEQIMRRCKASIIQKKTHEKEKEIANIDKSINEKGEYKEKNKEKINKIQQELEKYSERINEITKKIQQATGLEQETLHTNIANLKAELEGLRVRLENYENKKAEISRRMTEMERSIPSLEEEIRELKDESPLVAQKSQELKKKKEEMTKLEEERKRVLALKTELHSVKERIKDKERQLSRASLTSENLLKQLEEYTMDLTYENDKSCADSIITLRQSTISYKVQLSEIAQRELEKEKAISVAQSEIQKSEKVKKDVESMDVCPLCKSQITKEHIDHVNSDATSKIELAKSSISSAMQNLSEIREKIKTIQISLQNTEKKISVAEIELVKHKSAAEKKEQLKKMVEEERMLKDEILTLENKRKQLEEKTLDVSKIEEKYDQTILEIEEISSRTAEDVDTTLLYKERDLENIRSIIKRSTRDHGEVSQQIEELQASMKEKKHRLQEKESQEQDLQTRFKKMFEERENIQKQIQEKNLKLSEVQSGLRAIEEQINYLKIGKAKIDAEHEALQMEYTEFSEVEIIQGSISFLEEKLQKTQETLQQIGSINMRALEVYKEVKKEYDIVQEKVNTLDKEKQDIVAIISEIDNKKRRSFMKTYRAMNALFSENFSKLYSKGTAFLELENEEDLFSGGVNIVVKLAKSKYFDVTSLSGGEQTLVALSLLFAIQEYKPYHLYVFDEIDAALDKRNSERLAGLLSQYMKSGQYIVITHNDAIILNSHLLYGVSMHDGVSKILSLNIKDSIPQEYLQPEKKPEQMPQAYLQKATEESLKREIAEHAKEEIAYNVAPLANETIEESIREEEVKDNMSSNNANQETTGD